MENFFLRDGRTDGRTHGQPIFKVGYTIWYVYFESQHSDVPDYDEKIIECYISQFTTRESINSWSLCSSVLSAT
jgi:hypothetical protein